MLNEALTETKNRIRRNTEVFQIAVADLGKNCLAPKDLWRMKNDGKPRTTLSKIQPVLAASQEPGYQFAQEKYARIALNIWEIRLFPKTELNGIYDNAGFPEEFRRNTVCKRR